MSCRHDLALGTCTVCYPKTGTFTPTYPGTSLDGPGALPEKKKPSRYIVLCLYEHSSEPGFPKCCDSYEEALAWAAKYWTQCAGLAFDPYRKDPFYVEPNTYAPEVSITRRGRGKEIRCVSHEDGEGCCIYILPEAKSFAKDWRD